MPILIKDLLDTADRMHTTSGSLALEGIRPAADSTIAARLRAPGAVSSGSRVESSRRQTRREVHPTDPSSPPTGAVLAAPRPTGKCTPRTSTRLTRWGAVSRPSPTGKHTYQSEPFDPLGSSRPSPTERAPHQRQSFDPVGVLSAGPVTPGSTPHELQSFDPAEVLSPGLDPPGSAPHQSEPSDPLGCCLSAKTHRRDVVWA
jgi:hypothetical protein